MNTAEFLKLGKQLNPEDRHLVARVAKSIEAGDSYFLVFHTAFEGIITDTISADRMRIFENEPVYKILNDMVEEYQSSPLAYRFG